jgi:type II secretory pathway pseudopilin PulG
MKGGRFRPSKAAGFTIIEVMLVLAVTGLLFVMFMLTMSGKQRRTEFGQSANDFQTVIQQTINEVSSGYYPDNLSFNCKVTGTAASPNVSISSSSGVGQGEHEDCVFLGKVMQFGVKDTDPEQYAVFSIAGSRTATNLGNSGATVIETGGADATVTGTLKYGVTVKAVKVGAVKYGAVAFINSLGKVNDGNYQSGSQTVNLVVVPGTDIGEYITPNMRNDINSNLKGSALINPASGVTICLTDGGSQTALITIGSNGHNLQVKMAVVACS